MRIKIIFIITVLAVIFSFNCTVNESTALIRLENMSNSNVSNIKIGDTTISCYLSKGGVYDYWTCSQFEGIVTMVGVESNYINDVYLKIRPDWEYNINIITNEDGDDVWNVGVSKRGSGNTEESEVKELQ